MLKQPGISVVAVNSHNIVSHINISQNTDNNSNNNTNNTNKTNNYVSTKKVPSLFKRLFSRDSTKNQDNPLNDPYILQATKDNNTTNTTKNNTTNNTNNITTMSDLCSKCQINPPQISVAKSNGMKAEKLCSGCHILTQQPLRNKIQKVEAVDKFSCENGESGAKVEGSQKTVIVMQANCLSSKRDLVKDGSQKTDSEWVQKNKVEVVSHKHCNFGVLQEKPETTTEQTQLKTDKPQIFKLSFQPSFRKGDSKPNYEARIVSNDVSNGLPNAKTSVAGEVIPSISEVPVLTPNNKVDHEVVTSNLSPCNLPFDNAYDSDDNLPQDNMINFEEEATSPTHSTEAHPQLSNHPPHTLPLPNPLDRPSAFNPDYRGTLTSQQYPSLDLPSELQAPPTQFNSKVEEMMHNDLMEHQRIIQQQEQQHIIQQQQQQHFLAAPPRYEDIVKSSPSKAALDEYPIQLIKSFGKPSSQPQPGSLKQPSFIKLSATTNGDVVVVTDPALNSLQVFDSSGKCMAMVRVEGVVCGCGSINNTLLVACEDKVALYRYDGSEKASMAVDSRNGNEVRSLTRFKKDASFGVVAQKTSVFVVDCSFQNVSVVKKFTAASSRKSFKNVVDIAMTNKDDMVVVDSGDNHTSIYVIATTSGHLKSVIYPKHESCGPISNPTSVCLDETNRIFITDSSHKRLLVVSAKNPQNSDSRKRIVVRKVSGMGEGQTALGLDISASGLYFMVLQKEQGCVVSVFSVMKDKI